MKTSKAVLKTLTGSKGNDIFNEIKNMKPSKPIKKASKSEMEALAKVFINRPKG